MSSEHDETRPSSSRRVFLSAVFVVVLYCDFASIVNLSDLAVRVPVNATIGYYNAIFRVFHGWSRDAYGYVLRVQVTPADEPDASPTWREVFLHDLFPMTRGESYTRLQTLQRRHPDELAGQLHQLYQRQNPDVRVHRARLLVATWPTSTESYLDRYDDRRMQLLAESP